MKPLQFLFSITAPALLGLCLAVTVAPSYGASKTAARVNGAEIGIDEYRQDLDRAVRRLGVAVDSLPEVERVELKRQVLDELIARELLFQESVRKGITVASGEVDGQMRKLREQFASGRDYDTALESLSTDEDDIRRQIARGMAVQRYIDREFASAVTVREEEVRRYYDNHREEFTEPRRVRVSHILLTDADGDTAAGRKKLKELRRRILAGKSFAETARKHSRCLSRERGGDIGFVGHGELAPEMEKVVFSLAEGEVSDVVEDRFGLHLVTVTDIRPERVRPYKEVSAAIKGQLKRDKATRQAAQHVRTLRDKARVELVLDGDDE
ncbi:hypothetical protein RW64_16650 [Geobacter sulfurreducens]|nr:hypothetical protein RW64_16650 [Geobacter sulfurreducens]